MSYGDEKRRVLYAKDVHQLNLVLGKFVQKSEAETVLLVDNSGHLLARQGVNSPSGEDTIAAIVAGTFNASQAMAAMLGDDEFSSLVPCGEGRNVMLLRSGPEALLAVAFDDQTSETLVRTYALEAVRRLTSAAWT
ncbi:MAG: roadblock/LC7 domain-containing protein, partial [Planctomycetota bacterium]|nr:roadblock/LC7 domain-containing protein [Planctomycetota bacterium]